MPSKPYKVRFEDLPRQSRFGGAMQETAVVMDAAILKFAWGKPSPVQMTGRTAAAGKPDQHPWDQLMLILKGRVEVTLGDNGDMGTYELEAGELIYIPGNVPHIGRTLGEEEAIGVEVFAPVREDYLDMAEHQLAYERGEAPAPSQPRQETAPAAK
jgi:mannose-6-phosphate isomerase-like protein (cupin superfamily)